MASERLFGFSNSGIDVDSMVTQMMQAKKLKYTTMYQNKTRTEWKKKAYNDVNTLLREYRSEMLTYKYQSTLSPKKTAVVNTGGTSNTTTVLTATATADAANVSHDITVNKLAQGAGMTSTGKIGLAGSEDKKLTELLGIDGATNTEDLVLTMSDGTMVKDAKGNMVANVKTITYKKDELKDKTIYDLVSDMNKAGLNVKTSYDEKLDRVFVSNSKSGQDNQITLSGKSADGSDLGSSLLQKLNLAGAGSNTATTVRKEIGSNDKIVFTSDEKKLADILGGATGDLKLSFDDGTGAKQLFYREADLADKTVYDLVSDINNLGTNIKASYNADSGKIEFQNNYKADTPQMGDKISISSLDGSTNNAAGVALIKGLNLNATGSDIADGNATGTTFISGQNSEVVIDGVSVSEASNSFTVAGVEYSVQNTGSARVTVDADIDKEVEVVKKFVESYNKTLSALNALISEPYYKDYAPLTDEQKKEMSDSQITAWEKQSKSGMLYNDTTLKKLVRDMRTATGSAISGIGGNYTSLSSLGVSTNYAESGGKLYVDEGKLKKALQADPDALSRIFKTDDGDAKTTGGDGVAVRIYDKLSSVSATLVDMAGSADTTATDTKSTLAKKINRYKEDMKAYSKKLTAWETQYYNQFSKMEQVLTQLNSQMSSLSSMFG